MNNNQRGFTVTELIIALGGVATLALMVVGVVVLAHFISKWW